MVIVGVIGWIVVGLVVAFVATKFVNLRGDDPRLGSAAAVGGAIVGGVLHSLISGTTVTAWNVWSILFALIGAVAAIIVWHAVRSRTISHERQTTRSSY